MKKHMILLKQGTEFPTRSDMLFHIELKIKDFIKFIVSNKEKYKIEIFSKANTMSAIFIIADDETVALLRSEPLIEKILSY